MQAITVFVRVEASNETKVSCRRQGPA